MRPGTIQVSEGTLETAWWGKHPGNTPTIVLLHEGLGCVALWRDFPEKLAAATGLPVFAYSRFGYGQSDPVTLPRPMTYMHHEAQTVLPELLTAAGIKDAILIGHSDGGSIAAIHAGTSSNLSWPAAFPSTSWPGLSRPPTTSSHPPIIHAVVTIAAHFFVEDLTIQSIAAIKHTYETTDLRTRLGRHHRDPENAFRGWNDAWLDPRFRAFDITAYLPAITAPILAIQGTDDPYGTPEQLDILRAHASAPLTTSLIPGAKHAPHLEAQLEASEKTLSAITHFILEHARQ